MRIPAQLRQTLISAGVVGSFVGVLCAVGSFAYYSEYAPPITSGPDGLWEHILDAIGTFLMVTAGIIVGFGLLPSVISCALTRRLSETARRSSTRGREKVIRRAAPLSASKRKCDCAELDDVVQCGDSEQGKFVSLQCLRFLRERCGARLYLCMGCSTYWQVEHRERGPQATRIGNPFRWQPSDRGALHHHAIERDYGAAAPALGARHDGDHRVLEDGALCATHGYPDLGGTTP